jgi:hypothetical protein
MVVVMALAGMLATPVHASIRAWGCLLYASNSGRALELPSRLGAYETPLRRSLGYSNYRVIAQHEVGLINQPQNLLVSAGDIQVILTSLSVAPDGKYLVGLLFVEGIKEVMEAQARVGLGSPLFIRGPDWREGQIIIVFMMAN